MESTDQRDSKTKLIEILQLAYSGERAAGYAYRGHWKSVSDLDEKQRIKQIEDEEWHHRRLVGEMLAKLDREPNWWRELRATVIGRTLGFLCHLSGWLLPMYGAGKLESRNIVEYETAARHARVCGCEELSTVCWRWRKLSGSTNTISAERFSNIDGRTCFQFGPSRQQKKPSE